LAYLSVARDIYAELFDRVPDVYRKGNGTVDKDKMIREGLKALIDQYDLDGVDEVELFDHYLAEY